MLKINSISLIGSSLLIICASFILGHASDLHSLFSRQGLFAPLLKNILDRRSNEPIDLDSGKSPASNRNQILTNFRDHFMGPRAYDTADRGQVVDGIVAKLKSYGLNETFEQSGNVSSLGFGVQTVQNIITIIPGNHRKTDQERILVLGAHWDTVRKTIGIDDNGSGSVSLLEIARLISENKCKFEFTIILVWFDLEEIGALGSQFFVNDYLYEKELDPHKSQYLGAYVLDMVMISLKDRYSQMLIPGSENIPGYLDEIANEGFRGDFIAALGRQGYDEALARYFKKAWNNLGFRERTFKPLYADLPNDREPNLDEKKKNPIFYRSDHASFWYPQMVNGLYRKVRKLTKKHREQKFRKSLSAVLISDMGPWRTRYYECYHSTCDNSIFLIDEYLTFMQQVIDTLMLTILRIGHGKCEALEKKP